MKIVLLKKLHRMRNREIKIRFKEYDAITDLSTEDQKLILAARESSKNAYAPYSKFKVGAALLMANNVIVEGNNQENADFTDGLCAERVALFYAHSKFPEVAVKAMAVSASNSNGIVNGPVQPCGSCRQVMVETEVRFNHPIRIILDGTKKIVVLEGSGNLLPFAFSPNSLD